MSENNIAVELQALQLISSTKNAKLINQLEVDWFTSAPTRIALKAWKQNLSLIDYINFNNYIKDNVIPMSKVEMEELFATPFETADFDSCVKVLRKKYTQREIAKKIDEVRKMVFNKEPKDIELELITYFKESELIQKERNRKITDDDDSDEDEDIIDIGKGRPLFEEIVPMRKTVSTLLGNSGHLKTGQSIDINIRFLNQNPDKNVLFFSKEMEWKEMTARVYGYCLGIDYKSILKRKAKDGTKIEIERLKDQMNEKFPHIVEHLIIKSPQEFKTHADIAKYIGQVEPTIVTLDFLQWFAQCASTEGAKEMNVNVMQTMAFIKNIAQIENVFFINLSQIRKKSDSRVTVFPRLDDIEWSGLTKQISHSCACLFWPYKHLNTCEPNYYIISWQKVRNGETFTEDAWLYPETGRFDYPAKPATTAQSKGLRKTYLTL